MEMEDNQDVTERNDDECLHRHLHLTVNTQDYPYTIQYLVCEECREMFEAVWSPEEKRRVRGRRLVI